ncbi:metal-dependent hydrolase family protein [Lentzea jiangxiensis]|uniref:Imidazolonepropionase n=1 Tax=Lentzea jiangxiensis TaxID=641025 RepID=A0A1H0SJY3_9PSEU|nr:amidohydrolase family protein [Lentzea jiangxiensis]SDP41985.1 Imidazolonepropionase [Lentzea jiangxiensis]
MSVEAFALVGGMVFDGNAFHEGPVSVVVRGGVIDEIGSTAPDGVRVVDLGEDACLLPGLIDTHVHLVFDAGVDPVKSVCEASEPELLESMRRAARRAVHAGVTTIRDLGDRDYLSLGLRDELAQDVVAGPEILPAGPPITTPGGHCFFLGGETAPDAESLISAVRERHSRGCSVIKVMASGGNMTPGSLPTEPQFGRELLKVVVDEAHRLGLPVAAHAHGVRSIDDAIAAGVDSIEHASFVGEQGSDPQQGLMEAMAARDVAVSATLGFDPVALAAMLEVMSPGQREQLEAVRAAQDAALQGLFKHGVKVSVGSDAGIAPLKPHDVLPHGLVEMARHGWSPGEVLTAATRDAAKLCGVEGRKGELVTGADADFLVVRGNPVADLERLLDVRAVLRMGHRVR